MGEELNIHPASLFAIPLSFTTASCHTELEFTINRLGTNVTGVIAADVRGGFTDGVRRTDVPFLISL